MDNNSKYSSVPDNRVVSCGCGWVGLFSQLIHKQVHYRTAHGLQESGELACPTCKSESHWDYVETDNNGK